MRFGWCSHAGGTAEGKIGADWGRLGEGKKVPREQGDRLP